MLKEQHDFVLNNVDTILKLLFPEHGRTSCSDTNVINGSDYETPRCNRCQLLRIKSTEYNETMALEASLVVRCKQ